jgi:osmotically-inducible protein OsmY
MEGEVSDEADRVAAEQAARAVPGVRELQSELLVHAPPTPIGG